MPHGQTGMLSYGLARQDPASCYDWGCSLRITPQQLHRGELLQDGGTRDGCQGSDVSDGWENAVLRVKTHAPVNADITDFVPLEARNHHHDRNWGAVSRSPASVSRATQALLGSRCTEICPSKRLVVRLHARHSNRLLVSWNDVQGAVINQDTLALFEYQSLGWPFRSDPDLVTAWLNNHASIAEV